MEYLKNKNILQLKAMAKLGGFRPGFVFQTKMYKMKIL